MLDLPQYNDLITKFPQASPFGLLTFFLLSLMRVVPAVVLAPFLGARLTKTGKMGLSIALALILLPKIISTSSGMVLFSPSFLAYSAKELFIGFIIGFMSTIPFYYAESAGVLIDHMRGSSSLMVQDPLTETQVSSVGLLYNYVLIVLFFEFGGPFLFIDAILESYSVVPVDRFIDPVFFSFTQPFWQQIASLATKILTISIQLSAPAILAILMAEVFLGIANRLAPQVQIVFLGMPIKSLLGIGLLAAGWFYILKQLGHQSISWVHSIKSLIQSL